MAPAGVLAFDAADYGLAVQTIRESGRDAPGFENDSIPVL
jgi:hypothetical protein